MKPYPHVYDVGALASANGAVRVVSTGLPRALNSAFWTGLIGKPLAFPTGFISKPLALPRQQMT